MPIYVTGHDSGEISRGEQYHSHFTQGWLQGCVCMCLAYSLHFEYTEVEAKRMNNNWLYHEDSLQGISLTYTLDNKTLSRDFVY